MVIEAYPSIVRRYLSTVVDSFFILSMVILSGYCFQQDSALATQVRVGLILFLFFVYEPICTSLYCTVGQKVTGIRVRNNFGRDRISLPKAYLRIVLKVILGFISFFTIAFSKEKRALHDLIIGSVVLVVED